MKAKITYGFLLLCVTIFIASCSSSKNIQTDTVQSAQWQKDTVSINGDDGDWTQPLSFLDEKMGLLYAVSNDNQNLYVQLKTSNETTIQRILRGGLTLYINNHGVKEEAGAAGISFPTGNRSTKDGQLLNNRPELQQNNHVALNNVQDYSLFGFNEIKAIENFDYGNSNKEGIDVAIGMNSSNALVYEVSVPLRSFLNKNDLLNPSRKSYAVGFVIESVPGQSASRGGGGGVSIGGGLGFGSFGSGGGVGLSIGSGSLANIGGRKNAKAARIWKEMMLSRALK